MRLRPSTWHRHRVIVMDDMGLRHECRCPLWRQIYWLVVERFYPALGAEKES